MKQSDTDINIDLWPAGRWEQHDLDVLSDILKPFGSTSGQLSSDIRGLDIQTVIAFASGTIAAGFFEQIGSNLSDWTSTMLKPLSRHLKTKIKDGKKERVLETHGRLSIYYDQSDIGLNVSFVCRYSNEKELGKFLLGIQKANSIVNSCVSSRVFPFDKGAEFLVNTNVDFTESPTPKWYLKVHRFQKKNELYPDDEGVYKYRDYDPGEKFSAIISNNDKFVVPNFK